MLLRSSVFICILSIVFSCSSEGVIEQLINTNLPENIRPIQTIESSNSHDTDYKIVRYSIDEGFINLVEENVNPEYKFRLPLEKRDILDPIILKYVSEADEGFYVCRHDYDYEEDMSMVIVNRTKKELIYFRAYQ